MLGTVEKRFKNMLSARLLLFSEAQLTPGQSSTTNRTEIVILFLIDGLIFVL